MYRISKKDGTELGITDEVRYIKKSSNGSYIEAKEGEAEGVALDGVAYSLTGHDTIDGEVVTVAKVSTAKIVREALARIEYLSMMTGIDTDVVIEEEVQNDEGGED